MNCFGAITTPFVRLRQQNNRQAHSSIQCQPKTNHDPGNNSSASLNKGNVVFTFSIDINQTYIWLQLLVNGKLFHKSCSSNLKQWSTIRVYIIILFSRRKIVNMHLPTYKDVAWVSALAWEKNVPTVSKI